MNWNKLKKPARILVLLASTCLFSIPSQATRGGCNDGTISADVSGAVSDFCRNCSSGDWVDITDVYTGTYETFNYDETCLFA